MFNEINYLNCCKKLFYLITFKWLLNGKSIWLYIYIICVIWLQLCKCYLYDYFRSIDVIFGQLNTQYPSKLSTHNSSMYTLRNIVNWKTSFYSWKLQMLPFQGNVLKRSMSLLWWVLIILDLNLDVNCHIICIHHVYFSLRLSICVISILWRFAQAVTIKHALYGIIRKSKLKV